LTPFLVKSFFAADCFFISTLLITTLKSMLLFLSLERISRSSDDSSIDPSITKRTRSLSSAANQACAEIEF